MFFLWFCCPASTVLHNRFLFPLGLETGGSRTKNNRLLHDAIFENTNGYYSILPALAFSLDMFEKTNQSFGVNEVLLASVLGAVVFSLFAAQPLVIVGVTGENCHFEH